MNVEIEVAVDRIVFARTPSAGDLRAVRAAVIAAVERKVARTSGARRLSPQTLARIGEAVGAAIGTKCS